MKSIVHVCKCGTREVCSAEKRDKMASLVRHVISRVASNASSSTSSSSRSGKSFSSWGTRRPRDSLEKIRERRESVAASRPQPQMRNCSIQDSEDTEDEQTLSLPVLRPPINRHVVCERYPKGKASLLVFLLNAIVIYAYGAAITGILDIFRIDTLEAKMNYSPIQKTSLHFMKLIFQYCISRMFYPFAGFIADVYIGRWRMIYLSILLLLTGYVIVSVAFTLEGQSGIHVPHLLGNVVNGIGFLFLSVGGGAFEATIIPFGVDQLQGASSAEISSYFYFFYFSRNLGMGGGLLVSVFISYLSNRLVDNEDVHQQLRLYSAFQPLVTTVILSVGLILMICFHHWFFKNTLWENPVKLIAKILCYAATVKRHLPVRNRAFRYGEERKNRIELAKITYDGKFPDEKVEDVKAFCRIFLILLSLTPTLFSVNAFDVLLSQEANQTLTQLYNSSSLEIDLYPNLYWGVNVAAILFILPVVNFLVIPSFPKLTIRARIGIGLVLYCIAGLCVVVIHAVPLAQHATHQTSEVSGIQLAFLLVPVLIIALAEVLTIVSVLEFIYAQSPESMKGLLSGLFYFFLGLTSIPSSALYYIYRESRENRILVRFHAGFTAIMVVGTVVYVVAAALHRNRQRHDEDSLQQRLIIENQLHSTISA